MKRSLGAEVRTELEEDGLEVNDMDMLGLKDQKFTKLELS